MLILYEFSLLFNLAVQLTGKTVPPSELFLMQNIGKCIFHVEY